MILSLPISTVSRLNTGTMLGIVGTLINTTTEKTVRLYNRTTGALYGTSQTTVGLKYSFLNIAYADADGLDYFVVGIDPAKVVNGAIADLPVITNVSGVKYVYQQ